MRAALLALADRSLPLRLDMIRVWVAIENLRRAGHMARIVRRMTVCRSSEDCACGSTGGAESCAVPTAQHGHTSAPQASVHLYSCDGCQGTAAYTCTTGFAQ